MRTGKTIQELATEIQRQEKVKQDFTAPSKSIDLVTRPLPPTGDGPSHAVRMQLEDTGHFEIGKTCHEQLAQRLHVPKKYWDRCLAEAPELLAQNANHWLQRDDKRRMVRTLDGTARAYLSDKYRPLDNHDLCEAILPSILNPELGLKIKSCEITDSRLYMQVVSDRVEGDVKLNDPVQAGFVISNSEIGHGSFRIDELLWRLVCLNGMIGQDVMRKYHTGGKHVGIMDDVQAFYRDSTRKLDDAAFFSKVRDTVEHVISPERFAVTLAKMQGAAEVKIKPIEGIQVVTKKFDLSEEEGKSILTNLINGQDTSMWGLANAVTRMAHDVEDYDRCVEFERMGSQVVELPRSAWQELDALAA